MDLIQFWADESARRTRMRTSESRRAWILARDNLADARSSLARAAKERAGARKGSLNPLSPRRRLAAGQHRKARERVRQAREDLRSASRAYPRPWWADVSAAVSGAGVAVPGVVSALAGSPWPMAGGLAVLGGAGWVALRSRSRSPQGASEASSVPGDLSQDEKLLWARLGASWWVENAPARGLAGTLPGQPHLTAAGIECHVRLDDQWTPHKLRRSIDSIRALLDVPTDVPVTVQRGPRGRWALLALRTRSAADGASLLWNPDKEGIGICEVTGQSVDLPLKPGLHVLVAGRTGMGKSVAWRPLAMRALNRPDWAVVLGDPKRQEALGWGERLHRNVGRERGREDRLEALYALVCWLTGEMHRRQGIATKPVWEPDSDPANRFLLVVIEEGAALVRMESVVVKDEEGKSHKPYADLLSKLDELWGEARSVGMQFVWAVQNPTKKEGVPALVKDNMGAFLSLTTNAGEMERAVFGEQAQSEGWEPSKLGGQPGRALLKYKGREPDPLRVWFVTDEMVSAQPDAGSLSGPVRAAEPDRSPDRVSLVKTGKVSRSGQVPDCPADLADWIEGRLSGPADAERTTTPTVRDRVLSALKEADAPAGVRELARTIGKDPGSVSRTLRSLEADGVVRREESGKWACVREESRL